MNELSTTTRALLRAAREDGPGAGARSSIWSGVAAKAAGGVAIGAAGSKAAATAGTAKLLVMGALLGSAVTVGVAAMLLHVGAPTLHADPTDIVHADTESAAIAPATRAAVVVHDVMAPPAVGAAKRPALRARSADDALGREAQLVAEARGAVVRGEPEVALVAIHAAQVLPAHALEPEELSLEARALRALGRDDEARAVEARLRTRFPEHALAR